MEKTRPWFRDKIVKAAPWGGSFAMSVPTRIVGAQLLYNRHINPKTGVVTFTPVGKYTPPTPPKPTEMPAITDTDDCILAAIDSVTEARIPTNIKAVAMYYREIAGMRGILALSMSSVVTHLNSLISRGLVQRVATPTGSGRPGYTYTLTTPYVSARRRLDE